MKSPTKISFSHIFAFLGATLWRALYFAFLGALGMALVGAVAGAVTGPIYLLLAGPKTIPGPLGENVDASMVIGVYFAVVVALFCGALAFFIAGLIASKPRYDANIFWPALGVFWPSLRRGARGALLGVAIGGFVGVVNMVLATKIFGYPAQRADLLSLPRDLASAFQFGVTLGFAIGAFYGAIRGALDELKRQRTAQDAEKYA